MIGAGASVRPLMGRRRERERLDRLLTSVRGGESQALVISGEAGVGKTALLQYLTDRAHGCAVVRASGVESEMELAFAGLHQLCSPLLAGLDRVPARQRDALGTALGLRAGDEPDRFLVGLALVNLLSETARERPLICLVDDAQWLDRASMQALTFAARRLAADGVAVVFALRRPGDDPDVAGLPGLRIGGLSDGEARTLLDSVITGPMDAQVRDRILAETRGNPLALLQLPRGLTPEQIAGGLGLPGAGSLSGSVVDTFERRLAALPPATRRLLVIAAAESGHDSELVWRAAGHLGVGLDAAAPAVAVGLMDAGRDVRFCHPLARTTTYRSATPEERRRAHRALADATDPGSDPDRRAWHRAHATLGLDEDVAAELERSAGRAQARGGVAAAAAFRERAAELTPDPRRRSGRALTAAQAKYRAGAPDRARRLLAIAEAGPQDELSAARAELLRAQIDTTTGAGQDAPLIRAARRLEPLDPVLARATYRDAFYAALTAGRHEPARGMRGVAEALRSAPAPAHPPQPSDLLLDGLARLISDGYGAGAPVLQTALHGFRDADGPGEAQSSWLPLACRVSHDVWDDVSWHVLSQRLIALARERGAFSDLPVALLSGLAEQLFAGEFATAVAMDEEGAAVAQATGTPAAPYGALVIAAWRGREPETTALVAAASGDMRARGEGQWQTAAAWSTALLNNGLGRYETALAAAEEGAAYPDELGLANWSLVELVEAAARCGSPERAAGALCRLEDMAGACGTDWVLGVVARCRALLGTGDVAERDYREAIERLRRTRVTSALARAHLVYGEWLRRENRRVDAREHLRLAHDMLSAAGAEAFARRAGHELLATGETVRKRTVDTANEFTPQELHITRLAIEGNTNPEIGALLFISPRTVEWHLRKVFSKLGISSRKQLPRAMQAVQPTGMRVR